MLCRLRSPVLKINSKGTAVLKARRAGNRGKSKRPLKTTPVLRYNSEIGTTRLARAELGVVC
jgi:hypothetical protein